MEPQDKIAQIEGKYRAEIEQMKARFVAEKEELTTLFLDKLKEIENYHKKMLHDLVLKSNLDLDAIQAKHEEKLNFLSALHNKEIENLQGRVEELLSSKEELKGMLAAICEGQSLPKEKILNFLTRDSKKNSNQ